MRLTPLAVDHVALPIFDAAASHRFYTQVLELPLLAAHSGDDWGGKPWLMMIFSLGDGRQLALCALAGAVRPASELPKETHHLAFTVPSQAELAAWESKLLDHGLRSWREEHGEQHSLYFEEPNGYVLELTTPSSAATPALDGASAVVARWSEQHPVR